MPPCNNPNSSLDSPATSLVQAAAARRAAQRAQPRQTSEDGSATSNPVAATEPTDQWWRNVDDAQLPSAPPMRLTELLPLMRLRDTEFPGVVRPAPRLLTNADLIATIEQVLDIVDDMDDRHQQRGHQQVDPAVRS